MKFKTENVIVEEAKGNVSSKDATKYYGSAVLKFKDPVTKKKESFTILINNPLMIQALEKFEVEETLLDVTLNMEQSKFGIRVLEIVEISEVA